MAIRSADHEIVIGSTTYRLELLRDDKNLAMYRVEEKIPEYQDPLLVTQSNWVGGHGNFDFTEADCYLEGQSIDTTQDGRIILGPLITEVKESDDTALDSAVLGFIWFPAASKWLCWTTSKVYLYGTKWTAAATALTGVTDIKIFNGVAFAARGVSTLYSYSTDGDTWTATDLTDGYANKFVVAPNSAGTADILWKYKTPNEVSSTTDGRTVAAGGVQWTSPNYIGDTANNITNIFYGADRLFIGKTDSLWELDSDGGIHNLRSELKTNISTANFEYVTTWQTGTYHSEGSQLGEIIGGQFFEPMGPLYGIDDTGKVGTVVGLSADRDWLFVAIDEGTNTHIYKGHEVRREGKLRWEWCPWVFLSTNACSAIAVCNHTATDRRLWFSYGTTTGYVILTDNPTSDSAARFAAQGFLRMSYVYGTNPYWDKMFQSVVTQTKGCTANLTVTPKYYKDTDTSSTALTAAITTNGTVRTMLSSAITCNRISFYFQLDTNSSTTTPELLLFQARGIEKPEVVRTHDCTYRIVSDPNNSTATWQTNLRSARTSTALVKFADLRYGNSTTSGYVWVVAEVGTPQEIEIAHEGGRKPELGMRVRWREVSFTIS